MCPEQGSSCLASAQALEQVELSRNPTSVMRELCGSSQSPGLFPKL